MKKSTRRKIDMKFQNFLMLLSRMNEQERQMKIFMNQFDILIPQMYANPEIWVEAQKRFSIMKENFKKELEKYNDGRFSKHFSRYYNSLRFEEEFLIGTK
ncbi:MAG: hypothetical protein ABH828_01820 [archaeon]